MSGDLLTDAELAQIRSYNWLGSVRVSGSLIRDALLAHIAAQDRRIAALIAARDAAARGAR